MKLFCITMRDYVCKLCLGFLLFAVAAVFSIIQVASCDEGKIFYKRNAVGLYQFNENLAINKYQHDGARGQTEVNERDDSVCYPYLCTLLI